MPRDQQIIHTMRQWCGSVYTKNAGSKHTHKHKQKSDAEYRWYRKIPLKLVTARRAGVSSAANAAVSADFTDNIDVGNVADTPADTGI